MGQSDHAIFDVSVWTPALEKLGAVTHLTVTVYGADGRIVCGPAPPTPLFNLFHEFGYTPPILSECLRDCFAEAAKEPAVVVTDGYGVAVAGARLRLEGRIVGAAVAGYALTNLAQSAAIEGLARHRSMGKEKERKSQFGCHSSIKQSARSLRRSTNCLLLRSLA